MRRLHGGLLRDVCSIYALGGIFWRASSNALHYCADLPLLRKVGNRWLILGARYFDGNKSRS